MTSLKYYYLLIFFCDSSTRTLSLFFFFFLIFCIPKILCRELCHLTDASWLIYYSNVLTDVKDVIRFFLKPEIWYFRFEKKKNLVSIACYLVIELHGWTNHKMINTSISIRGRKGREEKKKKKNSERVF